MNLPNHVVLIPDGNRRWAKQKGLASFLGHRKGAETAEKILETALDLKIPCLTIWGCSVDNVVKRPKKEINFLMKIFAKQFKKLAKNERVHKNKIKINAFGLWEKYFTQRTKEAVSKALAVTKNYGNYKMNFMLAYSGVEEMTTAIKKIAELKVKSSKLKVDEKLIKNNLWAKNLPAVDLAIRTGGEPHWSDGFMMWDIANAQFYFTETLWPDFSPQEFKKAISNYQRTERRLGK
jgi:tritrans,polycis-undecaprenyl-diphosphate synthase [geranylgeranyl-diphosphate specific]